MYIFVKELHMSVDSRHISRIDSRTVVVARNSVVNLHMMYV